LEWKTARVYVFRRTIPELKQSIVPEIYKQCAPYIDSGGMRYNSQDRTFTFRNGSIIQLAYLENTADMYRYQSAEIHLLLVDELTHFAQDEYEYLKTRVRCADKRPLKVMAATNPGNIGHGWVKSYFIDVEKPETIYSDKAGNTRMFIPAKVDDHPIEEFRKSYGRQLDAIRDPDLKRALRSGDWDIFSGQVFTEWRRETDDGKPWHVVEPFPIPSFWTKWLAYDWGYNTYGACLWLARDPATERIYAYREYYPHAIAASMQAETINNLSGEEQIVTKWADPSLWKQHGNVETGESVAIIFEKAGLIFQPANNDRKSGMNAVHEVLAPQADGVPQFQVFSSCVNLIRTLPSLPYDPNKPEDVDTRAEDHLYDCVTGDTLVDTTKGSIPIKDLVGQEGYLYSRGGLVRKYSDVRWVKRKQVYKITLADGREVTSTGDHYILTKNGWKKTIDIESNDMIQCVTYGRDYLRQTTKFSWKELLSLWQILSEQGRTITSGGLAVLSGRNPQGLSRASQRPQSRPQRTKQSSPFKGRRPPKVPYEHSRSESQGKKAYAGGDDTSIKNLAQFPRRKGLALKAQHRDIQATLDGDYYLRTVRQRVRDLLSKSFQVLSLKLSSESTSFQKVTSKEKLGIADTYNLEVEGINCFSVNSGVIIHNCLRYGIVNQRPAVMPEMRINEDVVKRRLKYA
jgi:hypothetical protein